MKNDKLTVLAIDDDAGDAEILRRHLECLPGHDVELVHAARLDAAQLELARPGPEVIFLDYRLGAETAQGLLQGIRAGGDLRPVIVLTGQGDETIAASLMRSGADDYLVKSDIDGGTLHRAIENARAQCMRRRMEAKNRELLEDLQIAKTMLESRNQRLTELYDTAHQFVDHVSHEFRTPLTVIKEFASIMRDGLAGETSEEQREYLGIIVNRVDDLGVLVDDMLDISKLEAGVLRISRVDCSVETIFSEVGTTLRRRAAAAGARLHVDMAPDLPQVYCDTEKAGRVITNLVINALKFCGQPGQVALRARGNPDNHEVTISVTDNGQGIAAENLKALFQRFRQIDGQARCGVKGFGLGLSIARELVNLNLGDIGVQSEPGAGSTFSFTIPCSDRRPLLRRFLQRLPGFREDSNWVALVHLESEADGAPELLDELGHLVQQQIRRGDLLFRAAPHRWLLVAAANESDLKPMIERVSRAVADSGRNRPPGTLLPLEMHGEGSWNVHEQAAAFIDHFLAAEQALEPAHA